MILEKNKLIVPNKDITYFLAPDYIYVPASKIYVKNNDYVYKKLQIQLYLQYLVMF